MASVFTRNGARGVQFYGDGGQNVALQWALKHYDYEQLANVDYAVECPSCHEEAFFGGNNFLNWDLRYCCFSCGLSGDYLYCHNCGSMFKNIDHNCICAACRPEMGVK